MYSRRCLSGASSAFLFHEHDRKSAMVANVKIDSNVTGLRYAEEASLGVLPGSPVWVPLEPNSYDDFGGSITTKARRPINDSRQLKKGVVVDLDANGGFTTDLTATNMKEMLQGFFFADLRKKGEEEPTAVTATTDLYDCADTTGFLVNSLIQGSGFGARAFPGGDGRSGGKRDRSAGDGHPRRSR